MTRLHLYEILARDKFARGNFFRIIEAKVSHFSSLSVATPVFLESALNFLSNVRLISRGRALIMESCWGFSEMTIATAGALRRAQGVSAFSFDVFDTFQAPLSPS